MKSVGSRATPELQKKIWSAKTVLSQKKFEPLIRMQTRIMFPCQLLKLLTDGMENILRDINNIFMLDKCTFMWLHSS